MRVQQYCQNIVRVRLPSYVTRELNNRSAGNNFWHVIIGEATRLTDGRGWVREPYSERHFSRIKMDFFI